MIRRLSFNIIWMFFVFNSASAQKVNTLHQNGDVSLRGLSVVSDKVIWVSGSKGTVGRTMDSGESWQWMNVDGYEKRDFRDVEAFSKDTAIIMAVAEPACILKTVNGGKTWKIVYENKSKGMFLDAMDFYDEKKGIVIGDPIDGKFFIAVTADGGDTWLEVYNGGGNADSTEACFASSGTNIRLLKDRFVFVSGGVYSNLIYNKRGNDVFDDLFGDPKKRVNKNKLPIIQGTSSTGANSIAVKDSLNYIVVGGDFTNDTLGPNCAITNDGGKTWNFPVKGPKGYKSCVEYLYGETWICCGLTGVDISNDGGKTWNHISNDSYHSCDIGKNGKGIFFSGNKSRIGVLEE